jgi:5-methylcytosine-specific restriction endonuclease McrA
MQNQEQGMRKPGCKVSWRQLHQMLEKQSFKCALSGQTLTPETASLDHKVPLSKGGTHSIDNFWIISDKANAAKGTMTASEFIELCQRVTAWNEHIKTSEVLRLG